MLCRLQAERKEKDNEIKRLQDIRTLENMTEGPIKSGTGTKLTKTIYTYRAQMYIDNYYK